MSCLRNVLSILHSMTILAILKTRLQNEKNIFLRNVRNLLDPLCVKEVKQTQYGHHSADIINSLSQMRKNKQKQKRQNKSKTKTSNK